MVPWYGGWAWKDVIAKLREEGHDASAPALTGLGERRHVGNSTATLMTHIEDVATALYFDFSGYTPLCAVNSPYDPTPVGLARNREELRMAEPAFAPRKAIARAYAEQVGLKIDWTDPFATVSKLALLTQTPKEFDFDSSHWPKHFRHTGPFHDGRGRIEVEFPWDQLTGEPLVYASMGTLQNGLEPVFNTIAEAVGNHPGVQLVLSIGPVLSSKQIRSLPANAIVVNDAPQVELLKRATLCITHAGLNTALESLAQGVPMVAIPITNDQPGVAARIAHTKTGAYIPIQHLTVAGLATLIDEVLDNPDYRQNAQHLKKVIIETKGLEKAADLLEHAFGLSHGNTSSVLHSRKAFVPERISARTPARIIP
jgi:zeaxanthin glucosyltransferase